VLEQPNNSVLAHTVSGDEGTMVALHNLSAEPAIVPLTLEGVTDEDELIDLLDDGTVRTSPTGKITVTLEGYGYRWLRVHTPKGNRLR
jgi:hypothetical protein